MLPLIWGSIPDLGPSFQQFAVVSTQQAEREQRCSRFWRAYVQRRQCGNSMTRHVQPEIRSMLGDPNRRAIVRAPRVGRRSVREIADTLPISRTGCFAASALAEDAGLVFEEPLGTRRIYVCARRLWKLCTHLNPGCWGEVAVRFRLAAE